MKQRKDIGDIYKDLYSEVELLPDNNLWEQIEFKTEKIKFYRFGLNHFNIYYLSTIVLFSLLSIYSFVEVTSFIKNHPEAKMTSFVHTSKSEEGHDSSISANNSFTSLKDSIKNSQREKTKVTEKDINTADPKMNKATRTYDSLKDKSEVVTPNKVFSPVVKTDSIKPYNKANHSPQTVIKKEPKRRVVYIEQPDTIIVIDTLKGKEARKKRIK